MLFVLINCLLQAVDRHIPILVRTMGSSSDLLEIISDPPVGSENLLLQVEIVILMIWPTLLKDSMLTRFSVYIVGTLFQVLHTLTDGTVPSQELIFTIKKLYDSKLKVNHSVLLIVV